MTSQNSILSNRSYEIEEKGQKKVKDEEGST